METPETNYNEIQPGIISAYKHGWKRLFPYFLILLLISAISFLFVIVEGLMKEVYDKGVDGSIMFIILMVVFMIFVTGPVDFGVSYSFLKAARGDELEVKDMFEGFRNFWNCVFANILVTVIIICGMVAFLIPGVIFACKLAFVPYLVVDRKMDAVEAVKKSWKMTNGHTSNLLFMFILAIPIFLLGIIALVIGVIPALMWITLAYASYYHLVEKSEMIDEEPEAE